MIFCHLLIFIFDLTFLLLLLPFPNKNRVSVEELVEPHYVTCKIQFNLSPLGPTFLFSLGIDSNFYCPTSTPSSVCISNTTSSLKLSVILLWFFIALPYCWSDSNLPYSHLWVHLTFPEAWNQGLPFLDTWFILSTSPGTEGLQLVHCCTIFQKFFFPLMNLPSMCSSHLSFAVTFNSSLHHYLDIMSSIIMKSIVENDTFIYSF
jgi:hypothetical protein